MRYKSFDIFNKLFSWNSYVRSMDKLINKNNDNQDKQEEVIISYEV